MKIVLIGYMGSGKSSVGTLLAEQMDFPFIDLDDYIEKSLAMSIATIFATKGELFFRKTEALFLNKILFEQEKLVLATGGGTPCYGLVIQDLLKEKNTKVVYLKNSLDTLTLRLFGERQKRPLISHLETKELVGDFIRKHLFERSFYYNQAHEIVECDNLTPLEIARKIN